MGFKGRLKEVRLKRKLSEGKLAALVESHVTNISRYERGEHKPTTQMLAKLADALGTTADFLMSGSVNDKANATISDNELLLQFQEIEKLPNDKKYIIKELIDAFIFKF